MTPKTRGSHTASRKLRAHLGGVAVALATGLAIGPLTALASVSMYHDGALPYNGTANSIIRTWFGNRIENSLVAGTYRQWAYNTSGNFYIQDGTEFFGVEVVRNYYYGSQTARNWCQSKSGGNYFRCKGHY